MDAMSASAFKPLSDKTLKKIESGEISQQKLKDYLAKTTKEFNSDKAFDTLTEQKTPTKKKEMEESEKFLKEITGEKNLSKREQKRLEKEKKRLEKEKKRLEKEKLIMEQREKRIREEREKEAAKLKETTKR